MALGRVGRCARRPRLRRHLDGRLRPAPRPTSPRDPLLVHPRRQRGGGLDRLPGRHDESVLVGAPHQGVGRHPDLARGDGVFAFIGFTLRSAPCRAASVTRARPASSCSRARCRAGVDRDASSRSRSSADLQALRRNLLASALSSPAIVLWRRRCADEIGTSRDGPRASDVQRCPTHDARLPRRDVRHRVAFVAIQSSSMSRSRPDHGKFIGTCDVPASGRHLRHQVQSTRRPESARAIEILDPSALPVALRGAPRRLGLRDRLDRKVVCPARQAATG